jgi:hypothetical protein
MLINLKHSYNILRQSRRLNTTSELHNLSSEDVIRVLKLSGHVARGGDKNEYKILVGKPKRMRDLV